MEITIFGAGAFGSALGKILSDNKHHIKYYDPIYDTSLDQATGNSQILILAIPAENLDNLINNLSPDLLKLPTILASKGLLSLAPLKPFSRLSLLSGPAFASDIISGKPITLTATSPISRDLFTNDQISIELNSDLLGVLLCGSLKNIYAIGAGLFAGSVDNLNNYIQEAHQEMRDYLISAGANPSTAELSCGIGDLVLTATSPESRNFNCGKLLASGKNLNEVKQRLGTIEGLFTLKQIQDSKNFPIIQKIYQKVYSNV